MSNHCLTGLTLAQEAIGNFLTVGTLVLYTQIPDVLLTLGVSECGGLVQPPGEGLIEAVQKGRKA